MPTWKKKDRIWKNGKRRLLLEEDKNHMPNRN